MKNRDKRIIISLKKKSDLLNDRQMGNSSAVEVTTKFALYFV